MITSFFILLFFYRVVSTEFYSLDSIVDNLSAFNALSVQRQQDVRRLSATLPLVTLAGVDQWAGDVLTESDTVTYSDSVLRVWSGVNEPYAGERRRIARPPRVLTSAANSV